MYLKGFPNDYDYLAGLGSTNTEWVNNYQDPFNKRVLFPAADLAKTDKAAAYARLAPAFAQIQSDAVAFVNSHGVGNGRTQAQATIDRWKAGDFPLINGFLADWGQAAAAVAVPGGSISYQDAPGAANGTAPAIAVPIFATGSPAAVQYIPAGGGGSVVNVSPAAGETFGAGAGSLLAEWGPWIAGAAVVGLLLSSKKGK